MNTTKRHLIISLITMCCATFFLSCTDEDDDKPKQCPYISKVYDFSPSTGQFLNELPKYTKGDTKVEIIAKVEKNVLGKKNGGIVSLGGFGGQKSGSCESGVIMVSYDANENGLPDDEWYEIAGIEYNKTKT